MRTETRCVRLTQVAGVGVGEGGVGWGGTSRASASFVSASSTAVVAPAGVVRFLCPDLDFCSFWGLKDQSVQS